MTIKKDQITIDAVPMEKIPAWVNGKANVEGFFMGYQKAFTEVSQDKELGIMQVRVWLHFLGRMDFENWIIVPQKEIASTLDMQPADVCRAIKSLVNKEMLIVGPRVGRVYAYRVNKNFAWKGKSENRLKLIRAGVRN